MTDFAAAFMRSSARGSLGFLNSYFFANLPLRLRYGDLEVHQEKKYTPVKSSPVNTDDEVEVW